MDAKQLPVRPSLEQYKKQAKELVKLFRAVQSQKSSDSEIVERVKKLHPRFADFSNEQIANGKFALADAQFVIALEHGFESWPKFAKHVEATAAAQFAASVSDPLAAFLVAASVTREGWHGLGTLEHAEAILAAHPDMASANIYAAAVLADVTGVRRFVVQDARNAIAKGGPYEWDALTYLCFSKYLRLDRGRSDRFVETARVLLDAGADANTGWMEEEHEPRPTWESVIYGAAGLAQNPDLSRLLLERGADPNDDETAYHVSETYDNTVMKILVESGKLNEEGKTTLLLRKADWHDHDGVKWLLEHGVDPNRSTRWGRTAFHQAVLRDNSLDTLGVMLEHGADPMVVAEGLHHGQSGGPSLSAVAMAARRGRRDFLELLEQRGVPFELRGIDQLLGACARNDSATARVIVEKEPHLLRGLSAFGGKLLADFAGVGNTDGVRQLLDLGVAVGAVSEEGDGYFDLAKNSTALHSAAWRGRPETVRFLIERGAPVNALDGKGRTALMLAVKACVDSYWTERRTPESVETLLKAGANVEGVEYPCGYEEVDELLKAHGT
jgi:ankyrin repeat protein